MILAIVLLAVLVFFSMLINIALVVLFLGQLNKADRGYGMLGLQTASIQPMGFADISDLNDYDLN